LVSPIELCRDEALVEVGRRQRRCTLVRDGAPLCPPDSTSALKVHVLPALAPRGSPSSCPSPSPDAVMAVLTNSDDPLPVALRHPNIVDVGHPLRLLDHMLLVQLCSLTSCGNGSLSSSLPLSLSGGSERESGRRVAKRVVFGESWERYMISFLLLTRGSHGRSNVAKLTKHAL
jgi:hypothetical protein